MSAQERSEAGTKRTGYAALVANFLIAVAKFVAAFVSGSAAMLPEDRERIRDAILSFPEVTEVFRLLTMHLGPDDVLVNAEIHLVDGLDTDQVEHLLERVTHKVRSEVPEVTQTFIEPHPAPRGRR